ncbi:MAG: hypothetical protein NZ923_07780 [Candidatus Kryptonium sp.]|nr:hypothetical protein [Candidatus Kryptonium sp.]
MHSKSIKILTFLIFLLTDFLLSQPNKTIGVNFNYILSAFVYPNVISNDRGIRNLSKEINGWIGISADFRYEFTDGYLLGFSLEVVDKKVEDFLIRRISNQVVRIPVEDRFRIYIAELSLFFVAPFSSQRWNIYIGGGLGAYKGDFTKSILNVKSKIQKSPINLGIQVISGVMYNFSERFGARVELKFRDPMVETENKFTEKFINYGGYTIQIDQAPFRPRVNFDTMTLILGMTYSF